MIVYDNLAWCKPMKNDSTIEKVTFQFCKIGNRTFLEIVIENRDSQLTKMNITTKVIELEV